MIDSRLESKRTERRRYPRVDRKVGLNLQPDTQGYQIKGETYNLSPVGAYCQVDQPVPEMTRLMILLDLPDTRIECQGTVVRSEQHGEPSDSYRLAFFFHEISDESKQSLAEFLEI